MKLSTQNIHMNRICDATITQFVLQQDINLSENKPDIAAICMKKAQVELEEIHTFTDVVQIRGRLEYSILYETEEDGLRLDTVQSQIPFEETISVRGVGSTDSVKMMAQLEDFSISIINTRKLSMQAVVLLNVSKEELYTVSLPVALTDEVSCSVCRKRDKLSQIILGKKDVYRIRQEKNIPSEAPAIAQILWKDICLREMECRGMDGKVSLQGNLDVFMLYEAEDSEMGVKTLEMTIPFSGNIPCEELEGGMISDVKWSLSGSELICKPDGDGEMRVLGVETTIALDINVYKEREVEYIGDIYSTANRLLPKAQSCVFQRLLAKVNGKCRISQQVEVQQSQGNILQLLYARGQIFMDHIEVVDDGICVEGALAVQVLCITDDDILPYETFEKSIPYSYVLEVRGELEKAPQVACDLDKLDVTLASGGLLDVNAVLSFHALAFEEEMVDVITDYEMEPFGRDDEARRPGIVVYMVLPGDSLWSIGKKYYVTSDDIMRWNELESDEIRPGQKLLIVK